MAGLKTDTAPTERHKQGQDQDSFTFAQIKRTGKKKREKKGVHRNKMLLGKAYKTCNNTQSGEGGGGVFGGGGVDKSQGLNKVRSTTGFLYTKRNENVFKI